MSISAERLGALLAAAWTRYVDVFGEPPHGTTKQMAALCALMPAEPPAVGPELDKALNNFVADKPKDIMR